MDETSQGVLARILSAGNVAKRDIKDFVSNPGDYLYKILGAMTDSTESDKIPMAKLTPEKVNEIASNFLAPGVGGGFVGMAIPAYKSRTRDVMMKPEDFLKLAEEFINGLPQSEKLAVTRRLVKEGVEFADTPFLMLDEKGRVVAHEGRHRAYAMKEAGIPAMKVDLTSGNIRWSQQDNPSNFDYIEPNRWPETITSQQKSRTQYEFPIKQEEAAQDLMDRVLKLIAYDFKI